MTTPLAHGSLSRRRFIAAAGAATAGVTALGACGSGGSGDGTGELRVWTFLDPAGTSGREVVLQELITSFQDANPGVTVNVEVQQWDKLTPQFLAADASNTAPDVVWIVLDQFGSVAKQGALADLAELAFNKLPEDQQRDLADKYSETMQVEGELLGVVHSRNYFGLAYRQDWFDEAGIDAEEITTWDDLITAAKSLASRHDDQPMLGQAFSEAFADPQILTARLLEQQGSLFADDGAPQWATEEGIRALEFQASLINEHGITSEDSLRLSVEDAYELFSAGKVGIMNAASVRVPVLQEQLGADKVGFMHYPSEDGSQPAPGTLLGWAIGVWQGSEMQEAAAAFVAHLSSKEADQRWLLDAQQPPLYASAVEENEDFFSEAENAFLTTVVEGTQEYGWIPPLNAAVPGWREALNSAVQEVVLNGASPQEALTTAEQG